MSDCAEGLFRHDGSGFLFVSPLWGVWPEQVGAGLLGDWE